MTSADELRDRITREYEEIRAVLQYLRADDLPATSAFGVPVWRLAAQLTFGPRQAVRAAMRVAAGKPAAPWLSWTPMATIAAWRRDRLFRTATRADFLADWERAFNELFACVNDLAEPAPDGGGWADADRAAALDHLATGVEERRVTTRLLSQALSVPEPR